MTLSLYASPAFVGEYDRAYIDLQRLIQHAVGDLRVRCAELGNQSLAEYRPYKSLVDPARAVGLSSVREMKVAGGPRVLFAHQDSRLILIAAGSHDAEKQWDAIKNKKAWLRQRVANAAPAIEFGDPENGRFLSLEASDGWEPYYPGEENVSWLHFLDAQQHGVVEEAAAAVENHLLDGRGILRLLILGGPGTGKTVVLLKLLQQVKAEGFDARLQSSDEVHAFLSDSLRTVIPRRDDTDRFPDLLVVDDPGSLRELEVIFAERPKSRPVAIVAGFDPLQLDKLPTAMELQKLQRLTARSPYILSACYRQRAALAQRVVQMTDVLARSNPYLAEVRMDDFEAKYGEVLQSFNSLEFRYPRGSFRAFHVGDAGLRAHIKKVVEAPRQWKHCPPLLVVYDQEGFDDVPRSSGLSRLPEHRGTIISSNEVWRIKGLEYQHAVVWLAGSTYQSLQKPFSGSGERRYHNRRLLRIVASRARDSLTIIHT
jgi:hypothetical protein